MFVCHKKKNTVIFLRVFSTVIVLMDFYTYTDYIKVRITLQTLLLVMFTYVHIKRHMKD